MVSYKSQHLYILGTRFYLCNHKVHHVTEWLSLISEELLYVNNGRLFVNCMI